MGLGSFGLIEVICLMTNIFYFLASRWISLVAQLLAHRGFARAGDSLDRIISLIHCLYLFGVFVGGFDIFMPLLKVYLQFSIACSRASTEAVAPAKHRMGVIFCTQSGSSTDLFVIKYLKPKCEGP
jgi:hypothetical protein